MYQKAVFFDLDNTLTHRAFSVARYSEIFHQDFHEFLDEKSAKNINTIISRIDNGGYLSKNSSFSTIREAVSQSLISELQWSKPATVSTVLDHWVNNFPAVAVGMPGAHELVEELVRRNIAIGVISNGAEWSRKKTLDALSLSEKINVMISSERFGESKPSPKIFHAAAKQIGLNPEQCWYVGDHPVNDYLGAKNAGMNAIWLKGFHEWPNQWIYAENSVASLNEIITMICPDNSPVFREP